MIAKFEALLRSSDLGQLEVRNYARLMLSIYDLSNHHKLVDNSPHLFAIKLKLIAMKMICTLMKFIRVNVTHRLEREVEK